MSDERKANLRTPARAAVVGLLAGLLVWARAPFAPRNFWGEDGARFFSHALEDGWIEPIGRSLAGYYHLLPRLLGPLGTLVPIEWAPAAVFLGGAGAVAWLAASTWLADRGSGPDPDPASHHRLRVDRQRDEPALLDALCNGRGPRR